MKKMMLLAALGALATTSPALAQGKGNGHGNNKGKNAQSQRYDRYDDRGRYDRRDDDRSRYDRDTRRWDSSRVRYGDGRGYWYNGQYYRDGRYYGSNCPPGLAKKNNGCMPPGQAKKARWTVGQRLPYTYRDDYVPRQYRNYYSNGTYRYYDGYVYRVDPTTYVIREILRAVF